jgi:gamma-glutamyltranspeptidase/glutathione hydrolase
MLAMMVSRALLAAVVGLVAGGAAASAQRREIDRPVRQAERGSRAAIVAGSGFTAESGMRIFFEGGNAVDAGVAALFAASIAEFPNFGFGGEAPILIHSKGRVVSIAGIGTMPKLATAELFRKRKLLPLEVNNIEPNGLRGMVPATGLMPALVPGMVDAALLALRDFGTKPLASVIQPAIELADGLPADESIVTAVRSMRRFVDFWPSSKALFYPNGQPVMIGEMFRQPNLAATMRAMAAAEKKALAAGKPREAAIDAVRDYFYRGEIARKIDAFVKANNGLLRYEDLAAFRLEPEKPKSFTYQGHTVYKPDYWSQGPALLQSLAILAGAGTGELGFNSGPYIHTVTEALKLAYADRDTYYGDPRMVKVPPELLSADYGVERRKAIGAQATLDFRPGAAGGKKGRHPSQEEIVRTVISPELMARDTTSINTADKDGLLFSATPSGAWTPPVIAGDTGIPLTQRAQSFLLVPGHPNELAPGKRPRVTLSPTIVLKDGKPLLALSTPGGDNQDQSLLQIFLNVVEFRMNAQQAVEAPRFQTRHLVASFDNHAMNPGDLVLDERISTAANADLVARGHKIEVRSRWNGGAAPTMIRILRNGVLETGVDPFSFREARVW